MIAAMTEDKYHCCIIVWYWILEHIIRYVYE
jgi:hypothetical protein